MLRRDVRIPSNRAIRVRFKDKQQFESVFLRDISKGGMFLRTERLRAMGEVVHVCLDLPEGREIRLSGVVAHVVPPKPGGDASRAGIGLQLEEPSPEQLAEIDEYLRGVMEDYIDSPASGEGAMPAPAPPVGPIADLLEPPSAWERDAIDTLDAQEREAQELAARETARGETRRRMAAQLDEERRREEERQAEALRHTMEEARRAGQRRRDDDDQRRLADKARRDEALRREAAQARREEEERVAAEAARRQERERREAQAARGEELARRATEAAIREEQLRREAEASRSKEEQLRREVEAASLKEESRRAPDAARSSPDPSGDPLMDAFDRDLRRIEEGRGAAPVQGSDVAGRFAVERVRAISQAGKGAPSALVSASVAELRSLEANVSSVEARVSGRPESRPANAYDVLGAAPPMARADIEATWRSQSRAIDPEAWTGRVPEALLERMRRAITLLDDAWETLADPAARAGLDLRLAVVPPPKSRTAEERQALFTTANRLHARFLGEQPQRVSAARTLLESAHKDLLHKRFSRARNALNLALGYTPLDTRLWDLSERVSAEIAAARTG